jgi:hypothetical protein
MAELKWTVHKPTSPGWYWIRSYTNSAPRVAEVIGNGDTLAVWEQDTDQPIELHNYYEFAGPIEPPA